MPNHGSRSKTWTRILNKWHPEGIPWPASYLYNTLSASRIFQRQYQLIAEDVAGLVERGTVLDIGTGPARLPIALCRRLPGVRVTAADISPAMLVQARENVRRARLSDRIELKEAPASNLPFGDGSFDLVVSSGSLHHFKRPAEALDEIHRVLEPGRPALIYDLVRHLPDEIAAQLRREHGRFRITLLRWHSLEEPFYDPADMLALAASSRFATAHTRFVGALCCLHLK